MSKQAKPLTAGSTIGVMAPSSRIGRADLEAACGLLVSKGFKVAIHPQVVHYAGPEHSTQFTGTDEEKLKAFHDFVKDPNIHAILFATGGQRALRLLDGIDYKLVAANPKIITGFSDNTSVLNSIAARTGIVTWHGPTLRRMLQNKQLDFNLRLLAGEETVIPLQGAQALQGGSPKGHLVGGNLSAFSTLNDDDMPKIKDAILFLEDVGEELTTIDRHLHALRRRGIFDKAAAVIFGQFTNTKDTGTPFGLSFEDVVRQNTQGFKGPILINAPFGHGDDLVALPIGAKASIDGATLTISAF